MGDAPGDGGPAGGGPGDDPVSGDHRPRARRRGAPLLVAACVVAALAICVPLVLSAAKHNDPAAPATKVAEAAQEQPRTHKVAAMPSATSLASKSPTGAPKRGKSVARAAGPASTPHTEEKTPAAPEKQVKAPASKPSTQSFTLSPADVARANAASHATAALLKSATSGLCADIPGYGNGEVGGGVNTYACNGTTSDNQQWDFQVTSGVKGPGGSDLFVIKNHKDGLCMAPLFPPARLGTNTTPSDTTVWIREATCNTSTTGNELWMLVPRLDSTFWIRNYSVGTCLNESTPSAGHHDDRLNQAVCAESAESKIGWSLP